MRRTAEPDTMSDAASSSYISRGPPQTNSSREATGRQLFDHRKDDPVRFTVMSRHGQGRPVPTPKSSGEYVSASSTSSYAHSMTSSSFTLSSTTDGSSASSALFDRHGQPNSEEQAGNNVFAIQLKKLYRAITNLETKIKQEDADEAEEAGRVMLKSKEMEDEDLEKEKEKWKKQIEDHKR